MFLCRSDVASFTNLIGRLLHHKILLAANRFYLAFRVVDKFASTSRLVISISVSGIPKYTRKIPVFTFRKKPKFPKVIKMYFRLEVPQVMDSWLVMIIEIGNNMKQIIRRNTNENAINKTYILYCYHISIFHIYF